MSSFLDTGDGNPPVGEVIAYLGERGISSFCKAYQPFCLSMIRKEARQARN